MRVSCASRALCEAVVTSVCWHIVDILPLGCEVFSCTFIQPILNRDVGTQYVLKVIVAGSLRKLGYCHHNAEIHSNPWLVQTRTPRRIHHLAHVHKHTHLWSDLWLLPWAEVLNGISHRQHDI